MAHFQFNGNSGNTPSLFQVAEENMRRAQAAAAASTVCDLSSKSVRALKHDQHYVQTAPHPIPQPTSSYDEILATLRSASKAMLLASENPVFFELYKENMRLKAESRAAGYFSLNICAYMNTKYVVQ